MNNLRLFTNAIRVHQNTLNCVPKQWKNEQIWYFKRAMASFPPTAAAAAAYPKITRNAPAVDYNNNNAKRSTFCGDSRHELNHLRYQWILAPHSQFATGNKSNKLLFDRYSSSSRSFGTKSCPDRANKSDAKSAAVADADIDIFAEGSKLGLFARFKLMYKMYWYVLIPVHVVTSAGWICGFYYLSQSGVDVPALLQWLHLSENLIEKVQSSSLGHWAVSILCYKVVTPVRYAVTLGGTTLSIKYLVQQGYIKPMPTKAQIMQMYKDKKAQRAANKANEENHSQK